MNWNLNLLTFIASNDDFNLWTRNIKMLLFKIRMKIFYIKFIHFSKLIYRLITSAPFLTLSLYGNFVVFFFSSLFYWIEKDVNPNINHYIDSLWWAFSTTTTVGYGDVVPITIAGKFIGIFLMLIGVGFFGIYTALFARAILDDDIYMH